MQYAFWAYLLIWLILSGYMLYLASKQSKIAKEVIHLEQIINDTDIKELA